MFDNFRWNRVKKWFFEEKYEKFFVKYIEKSHSIPPIMNFLIVDDQEVIIRMPFENQGDGSRFIATTQPQMVRLFIDYFNRIWSTGVYLDRADAQMVSNFESRLNN